MSKSQCMKVACDVSENPKVRTPTSTLRLSYLRKNVKNNKESKMRRIYCKHILIQKQNKKLFIILVFCFTQLTPSNTPRSLHVFIITLRVAQHQKAEDEFPSPQRDNK